MKINYKFYQAASALAIIYSLENDKENAEKYFHIAISGGEDPSKLQRAIKYYQEKGLLKNTKDILEKTGEINEELYAAVKALKKNEIVMIPKENVKISNPGASKLGGKPYLPADFVWPTYTDKEDNITRPLSFLCQINLSDINPYDKEGLLPDRGTLYFFYECKSMKWGFDAADKGAARVFYCDTTDAFGLAPRDIAEGIPKDYVIPEIALQFKCGKSYPTFEEFEVYNNLETDFEEYDAVLEKLGINTCEDHECHKMLGYANVIQNEMLTEAERVSRGLYCSDPESYQNTPKEVEADIAKRARDWVLLCQISTITAGDFEFMFGDCGKIYFYIKKNDLAAMNFENVHFSVQCG